MHYNDMLKSLPMFLTILRPGAWELSPFLTSLKRKIVITFSDSFLTIMQKETHEMTTFFCNVLALNVKILQCKLHIYNTKSAFTTTHLCKPSISVDLSFCFVNFLVLLICNYLDSTVQNL